MSYIKIDCYSCLSCLHLSCLFSSFSNSSESVYFFICIFYIKFEPVCLMFIYYTQYSLGFTFWYNLNVAFIDEINHLNGLIRWTYLILMLSCFLFSWLYVGYLLSLFCISSANLSKKLYNVLNSLFIYLLISYYEQ